MKKNKVIELIMSAMKSLKLKNKKLQYVLIAILGLGLAFATQLDESSFGKDIDKLPSDSNKIVEVIQEEAETAVENAVIGILKDLF